MKLSPVLSRRAMLEASCSAVTVLGTSSLSLDAVAEPSALPIDLLWKDPLSVLIHNALTVETLRSGLGGGVITPTRRLFVRNNLSSPPGTILQDADAWSLAVSGVKTPAQLTLGQLKMMGLEMLAMVLQCSGNGRQFFQHQPAGTPWKVGGAGCVIWTGVPVRDVVRALGGVDGRACYMTGTGGEIIPEGIDLDTLRVERSVPLTALDTALLAWELNGEPIPLVHGGPLRLIVPGYYAVNSIKHIKQLAFTPIQSGADIQQSRYRMAPIGESGNAQQPSAWEMSPKSWITSPDADGGPVRSGEVWVTGVAMGGMNALARVDITLDDGKTWQQADFVGPNLGRFAWRIFTLKVVLRSGTQRIASRCRDINGVDQMEFRIENTDGYLNSSWRDHGIELQVL